MTRELYPTDLTDDQWERVRPFLPAPRSGGRNGGRPATDTREVLNAVFYHLRAGGAWRLLPHDFPPWESAYAYFRRWQADGTWQRVHDALRAECRGVEGREAQPTAAVLDSQSVKTTSRGGERGYDAGKKNRRPQAAPPGGLPGSAVGGGRPPRRRAGPRRGQARP